MNDFLRRMLAAGLVLTLPQTGNIHISSPLSGQTSNEKHDAAWFRERKGKRMAYIREAYNREFDSEYDARDILLQMPNLWVLVIFASPNHIIRIPIYRGKCPYAEEPETDEGVFAVVERCVSLGGIDIEAVTQWLQKKAASQSSPNA